MWQPLKLCGYSLGGETKEIRADTYGRSWAVPVQRLPSTKLVICNFQSSTLKISDQSLQRHHPENESSMKARYLVVRPTGKPSEGCVRVISPGSIEHQLR